MGYENDVFISYARADHFGEWVHDLFSPFFEPELTAALGRKAKVFIDKKRINSGQKWPGQIKKELLESKYLVAILSPQYFLSDWCQYEFGLMHYRSEMLKTGCESLIFTINIRDEKHFPSVAQELQWVDCRDYLHHAESFRKSEKNNEYENKVRNWVDSIADKINAPPIWDDNWMSSVWYSNAIAYTKNLFPSMNIPNIQPILE